MQKAAFLTYNTVGKPGEYPNGLLARDGREAIIVQHPKGQLWGATVDGVDPVWTPEAIAKEQAEPEVVKSQCFAAGEARKSLIDGLYRGVFSPDQLSTLDYVVVYVGAEGSEGAIRLAAQAPQEKVRFVMCDCAMDIKLSAVISAGLEGVPYLMCECGGRSTLRKLVEEFLMSGIVGPQPQPRWPSTALN